MVLLFGITRLRLSQEQNENHPRVALKTLENPHTKMARNLNNQKKIEDLK